MLAHVDVPFASSCFSPSYVAWIEREIGPASMRPLAEDMPVLARVSSDTFATMQALAWAFRSAEAVERATEVELASASVDDEEARALAMRAGPMAEVLRAAAELEMPLLRAVPDASTLRRVEEGLARLKDASPTLGEHGIELVPALGLRGRILGRRVFVGHPGIAGAEVEHVAWQAAHEATVHEVSARSGALPFLELERRALGLLRSRARRAGLGDAHARWLAHLDLREIGAIPDVEDPR